MIIKLNKKIYPLRTIKKSVKAFSKLADFKIKQNKDYFLIQIQNIKNQSTEKCKDEFLNYVLYMIKHD
jgi:hypothetical protein